ncbi:MAG TPA: hypothetical protein VEY91_03510 [Candidatus Limnocylindria bacterium]|nr:hypothetical protein [Candidatus Limnocylindria bacterium]
MSPAALEAPRLLLGGDALQGAAGVPRDRSLELAARYHEPESLAVSLSKAVVAGADGVLATPTPQLRGALALLKQTVPIYALLPHPAAFRRDAADEGVAGVLRARARGAGFRVRVRHALARITHGWAAARGDLVGLVPLLLELEAPRVRDLRGIVLSARLTDLALAARHRRFFERYGRFVHARFGVVAGLETHNLGHLLRALREWSLHVDLVVGPVNPAGVRMKPTPAELLDELRQTRVPVLAKELRGGGAVPLLAGARYAKEQGVYGMVADLVDLEDLGGELRALRAMQN